MVERLVHDSRLKNWYICFGDTNAPSPLWRFLKKGFRHVWAFAFDPTAASWVIYNPGWDGIVVRVVSDPAKVEQMFMKAYKGGPVLYCKMDDRMVWKPRVVLACTSQICHLIGLNLLVHTPWRLFCALKMKGATTLLFED